METRPPLPRQEGMGCFAKGCLVVVVGILLVGVVGVGAWFFYGKAVAVFTFAQPAAIRIEQVSDADLGAAEQKLNRLRQATANSEETTVEFTAAELNALIAREPLFVGMRNRVRVAITDSIMTLEMSVPLDSAPLPKLKGAGLMELRDSDSVLFLGNSSSIQNPAKATVTRYRRNFSPDLHRRLIAISTPASGAAWIKMNRARTSGNM
jgi:hypothetical protein